MFPIFNPPPEYVHIQLHEAVEILWLARKSDSLQQFIKILEDQGIYLMRKVA